MVASAGEKTGIRKAGVTCVVGQQEAATIAVLEQRARAIDAPLFVCGRDWTFEAAPNGFRYEDEAGARHLPKPSLHGAHQIANAALAVACASRLTEFAIDGAAVAAGLAQARWPARLQRLTRGPLVDATPTGWELWLDGGHNPAPAVALAETLKDWHERPDW